MKIIAGFIKTVLVVALAAVIMAVGCFTAVFFVDRGNPDDIFLFGYALVFDKDSEGKNSVWLVRQADSDSLKNGDGVVYYSGKYCSAYAMVTEEYTRFYKLDDITLELDVTDDNLVGEVLAVWQQK